MTDHAMRPDVPMQARGYDEFLAAGGRVGRTLSESVPRWREPRRAPAGSPNVVVVLFDDLGFADLAPYGSEIDTPTIDRLARDGVRFTNYHTTPLCSPSRAALLTGLNPHRAGFAYPANLDPGYPSYAFELPENAPTLAESLRDNGYATFAVGKWHLTGDRNLNDAGDRSSWPIQRGFDRYYGSLEGFTSLHAPHRLTADNSPVDVDTFGDDYFLTDDLTDRAIGFIRDLRANDGAKPFFLYLAHHAVHGPIQAKSQDLEQVRGAYEAGWDVVRRQRFERQVAAGLFPAGTDLPRANHEPGKDVPPWDSLTPDQQQRFARYQEVYAASVANVDANLARLYAVLEQYGEADNTLILVTSDNGATAEGGPDGTRSYFSQFAHVPGLPADWDRDVDRDLDLIGGPRTTVHYPRGWGQASNTPFRLYKSDTFGGGIRAPFVVHWPAGGLRDTRPDDDGIRRQFVYVTDVAQTVLDLVGVPRSAHRHNLPAADLDGVSAADLVRDPAASTAHLTQYTETAGNRGYFRDRWKIVTNHQPGAPYADTEWELYDLATDPTETRNLAADRPELLRELAAGWERDAWHNTVFPLSDFGPATALRRPSDERFAAPVTLYPGTVTLERYRSAQLIAHRDFRILIDLRHGSGDAGVLVAHGDQGGGYLAVVADDAVRFTLNAYGVLLHTDPVVLPAGVQRVSVDVRARPGFRWDIELSVGSEVESGATPGELKDVPQLLGMAPFTGISVGADKGGPVDWELSRAHGSHPYRGELISVRYEPGSLSPDSPAELARIWAEAARIYD